MICQKDDGNEDWRVLDGIRKRDAGRDGIPSGIFGNYKLDLYVTRRSTRPIRGGSHLRTIRRSPGMANISSPPKARQMHDEAFGTIESKVVSEEDSG